MLAVAYFFVFALGMVIGSFLNVVILRHNTGEGLHGRSRCFSCGKVLRWYELVPIASFLLQKGRCRSCASSISWQYPIVELLSGVLFLLVFRKYLAASQIMASFSVVYGWFIVSILLIISVYDVRHKIIPDGFVYAFIGLSFASLFLQDSFDGDRAIVGILPFLFFFLLWYFSKGLWMGFGDAKLALGIGWLLPFPENAYAIILGFWLGAIYGIFLLCFWDKKTTLKSEVPFAPFLVAGTLLMFLFDFQLWF